MKIPKTPIREFHLCDFDLDRIDVMPTEEFIVDLLRKVPLKKKKKIKGYTKQFSNWRLRKKSITLRTYLTLGRYAKIPLKKLEEEVEYVSPKGCGDKKSCYLKFPLKLTEETVRLIMYLLCRFAREDSRYSPRRRDMLDIFLKDVEENIGIFDTPLEKIDRIVKGCKLCHKLIDKKYAKCPFCGGELTRNKKKITTLPILLQEIVVGWACKADDRLDMKEFREQFKKRETGIPKLAEEYKGMCLRAIGDSTAKFPTRKITLVCGKEKMGRLFELLSEKPFNMKPILEPKNDPKCISIGKKKDIVKFKEAPLKFDSKESREHLKKVIRESYRSTAGRFCPVCTSILLPIEGRKGYRKCSNAECEHVLKIR